MHSCAARSQEDAEEEEDDADAQLPLEVCPRVTTPELPELRNSAIKASVGSGPNLTASPARPRSEPSVSEEKTGPNKIVASHPRRQGPAHAALESGTRSYPDRVHAAVASSENPGHDGDSPARAGPSSSGSTLVESSLRRVSKKRSSTQDGFVPVTQNAEGDTTIASKHPRLVSAALLHLKQTAVFSNLKPIGYDRRGSRGSASHTAPGNPKPKSRGSEIYQCEPGFSLPLLKVQVRPSGLLERNLYYLLEAVAIC